MDTLKDWWGLVLSLAAGLVWLMRLEARSLSNEHEIKRMGEQRKEDLENAQRARDQSDEMLTEIRRDVKKLLSKHLGEY